MTVVVLNSCSEFSIFAVQEENEERVLISMKAYNQGALGEAILAEGAIARSMTLCGGVLFAS